MKSRTFSIFLLKEGCDASNALKEDHHLEAVVEAAALPASATLFVLDAVPKPPWWKDYFGIDPRFGFIPDQRSRKEGREKPRKRKVASGDP